MKMRNFLAKAAVIGFLFCLVLTASAQKKRRSTARKAAPASSTGAAAATSANAADIKAGAEKVSIQLKNVTKFIFLLGTVAQGIQDVDADVKAGKASRAAVDINNKNKQSVVTTIRNLHAGLAALETEFQSKPSLRPYLLQLGGISDITGNAEDQAGAGQFITSGKTLLQVVEKLSDTLTAMP